MHLMLGKGIKHLPVLKDGRIVGVISDRDIKAYAPSKATSLDVYEINYLLAKATVKEAMGVMLTTTTPETPVEEAALTMLEGNIGCLPVLAGDVLVGIISDRDIFRALVDITGVRHGGHRVCLTVADRPGSIREVTDLIRSHGFRLHGILTSYEKVPKGSRAVVIRTGTESDFEALRAALEKTYSFVRIKKG
jgi:acetoin utilization protein AcuB